MRAQDGDWHSWLGEHGPALLLLARQYVPGRADAEDVVQEAFVRFWRARGRAEDPRAYLFACVRRCALEWLRGQRRRDRREETAARAELECRSPLFESALLHDERRRAIESALAALPAEQSEVIVLKVWGGLSFPEIGRTLDIPANTAASRYRYALERLRRQLSEEMIA
jgi:RNA polymerase sigma-70 factor (ECF subfamily)